MTKQRILLFSSLFLGSMLLLSCSKNSEVQQQERVLAVGGHVLSRSTQQLTRTFTGSLEGGEEAIIRAKLSEAVLEVFVKEGERVTRDERLISLDRTGPSSQFREAESVYRNAEKNYNKLKTLYDEGAISELELDGAKTEYEVAEANFSAARQLVEIQTPISGTVVSLPVSKGDFVSVGEVIAIISHIDTLRVTFEARLQDLEQLSTGAPVTVEASGVSQPVRGKVTSVARSADQQTRTFQVEVDFNNSQHLFRPGMFVRVRAVVATLKDVVTVPRGAVLRLNGDRVVFVVKGDRAYRRSVTIGTELEGMAVLTDGVGPGDTVVVVGQNYLEDSLKVNLTGIE